MTKPPSLLATVIILLFMATINQSFSARTLGNPTPNRNHNHQKITFLMRDVLNGTQPATGKVSGKVPFPKPSGIFPATGGIPIPQSNPTIPTTSSPIQTLDLPSIGFPFPTRATLRELEFGTVTLIDEELLLEGDGDELRKIGKVKGVYVASSEDGSSHMMAVTASFDDDEIVNGLRLFGVHRKDVFESHVAVIGGTGKYVGANGYAAVKVVNRVGKSGSNKLLLFDVYLSQ